MALTDMLLPVIRLFDQAFAPAVRPRYSQSLDGACSRACCERLEAERAGSEQVDDVAEALPRTDQVSMTVTRRYPEEYRRLRMKAPASRHGQLTACRRGRM
jgi:hypothetical protein